MISLLHIVLLKTTYICNIRRTFIRIILILFDISLMYSKLLITSTFCGLYKPSKDGVTQSMMNLIRRIIVELIIEPHITYTPCMCSFCSCPLFPVRNLIYKIK